MDQDLVLMKDLTETYGPPGFEQRIHRLLRREIEPISDEIVTDRLGSIVGRHGSDGPRVLVAGHLDEVAFIVSQITSNGFLRIKPLGGWWSHVLLAQRVTVLSRSGDIRGVVGAKAPHVLPADERKKVQDLDDMFVDIGASSAAQAEEIGVQVGDPVVTVCPFEVLSDPNMLLARTWDNRAGCYMAIKVLQRLQHEFHANTVYAGATVQEEVGLRGAQTLVNTVHPDVAFALDVGVATDTPGFQEKDGRVKLGNGPIVTLLDRSMIPHLPLRNLVIDTAKTLMIPYQVEIMDGGGTDAGKFHLGQHGVPSIVVGVPSRYIHSHVSVIHRQDMENGIRLVTEVIKRLDSTTVKKLHGMGDM